MDMNKQVVVGTYETEVEAEIAKSHLKAEGIEATILKDDGGGMLPSLQQSEGVQVCVSEERALEAKMILGERNNLYPIDN